MLADDPLGSQRERGADLTAYRAAFAAIEQDSNNHLIVAAANDQVIGVLQVTLIPNLTYQGAWRAQIEGVRVHPNARNKGIGKRLLAAAVDLARERKCGLVQLTTDKARAEALKFYQDFGFSASHQGMKLHLQ